jgi:hypothetical protein
MIVYTRQQGVQMIPNQPSRQQLPDEHEAQLLQKQIHALCDELDRLSNSVGMARQTIKYSRDRNKNTLAKYKSESGAETDAAQEAAARIDPRYLADMENHKMQDLAAEQTLARESALKSQLDAKRSLLSYIKSTLDLR